MAEATRTGPVSEIQVMDRGPAKAKVGTRSVRFWPTAYDSDEPSEVLSLLRTAVDKGVDVEVHGTEEERDGPKGKYTEFMAKSVFLRSATQTIANGAPGPSGAPQRAIQGANRDDPPEKQRRIAKSWALNAAIGILGPGVDPSRYLDQAKQVLDWFHYDLDVYARATEHQLASETKGGPSGGSDDA